MPTSLPARPRQTSEMASRLKRGLIAAYLVSVVAFCGLLAINGPQIRAAAEAQNALAIEEENKAFCSKFRIGPEIGRYAACANDLMDIRRRHEQRVTSDLVGIL